MLQGSVSPVLLSGSVCISDGDKGDAILEPDEEVLSGLLKNSDTLKNLHGLLSVAQATEVEALIFKYPGLFGDAPTQTDWAEHDIDVGDSQPLHQHFYHISPEKDRYLDAEVQYLMNNGLTVPSFSSWASPCLLVPKSDNTTRFCMDFRKVNKVTKQDYFPIQRMDDCVDQVGSAKYVNSICSRATGRCH